MVLKDTLHYASYFKWVFIIAAIILIFYSLITLPENLISIIGIILFLLGIYLGLDSLSDMDKMSKKEMKLFSDIKRVKILTTIIFYIC